VERGKGVVGGPKSCKKRHVSEKGGAEAKEDVNPTFGTRAGRRTRRLFDLIKIMWESEEKKKGSRTH